MKKRLFMGLLAVMLTVTFAIGCSGDSGETYEPLVTQMRSGDTTLFVIVTTDRKIERQILTPQSGDSYEIRRDRVDGPVISRGRITVTGQYIAFTPSDGAAPFYGSLTGNTMSVSSINTSDGETITNIVRPNAPDRPSGGGSRPQGNQTNTEAKTLTINVGLGAAIGEDAIASIYFFTSNNFALGTRVAANADSAPDRNPTDGRVTFTMVEYADWNAQNPWTGNGPVYIRLGLQNGTAYNYTAGGASPAAYTFSTANPTINFNQFSLAPTGCICGGCDPDKCSCTGDCVDVDCGPTCSECLIGFTMSFAQASITATMPSTIPTNNLTDGGANLTGAGTLAYTITGTNAAQIATINSSTGAITLQGPGTVTVTANRPATQTHARVYASYTLIVNAAQTPGPCECDFEGAGGCECVDEDGCSNDCTCTCTDNDCFACDPGDCGDPGDCDCDCTCGKFDCDCDCDC
ncbi:MAG: hypothetical protein FWG77_00495 [Treponema sp.]|nr:hypothetical protein [Treponema sp.]